MYQARYVKVFCLRTVKSFNKLEKAPLSVFMRLDDSHNNNGSASMNCNSIVLGKPPAISCSKFRPFFYKEYCDNTLLSFDKITPRHFHLDRVLVVKPYPILQD
jgi:hypothetical protein